MLQFHPFILNDFGLAVMDSTSIQDLMEIIEDRHGRSPTIIASQLPIGKWYDELGDNAIADTIISPRSHLPQN